MNGERHVLNDRWHIEGNRIIKTSNGEPIPDDEPIFLLRARDHLAVAALTEYLKLAEGDGCNDYLTGSVLEMRRQFEEFSRTHPEKMKQPGVTRGK